MDRIALMTTFAAVVAGGSFASAAERLNMAPASVSNHVQSLEDRLGVRLMNRTTRKLSLTEAGRIYYERCTRILAELDAAENSVSSLNTVPRGTLRVNAANVLSYSMAELVGGFGAANPGVAVELTITDRMIDLVDEGIDVALRFNQPAESSLIMRRLGLFRLGLYASPHYLGKHGTPEAPADLSRHNCIAYMYRGFDKLTREWTLHGPEGDVTVPVSCKLATNSIETLLDAALDGRGIVIAWAGGRVTAQSLRSGRLVELLPDYHLGEFPIVALYPHREHVPAKVRSFIDFAAAYFSDEPAFAGYEGTQLERMRRLVAASAIS